MQIDELNSYVKLFDTYGKLLSKKQFEVMDKFLNYNLSETELAELENGSRQSVHDAISKAKKQLLEFESRCEVVKNKELIVSKLNEAKAFLNKQNQDSSKVVDLIDDVLNNL